MTLFGVPFVLLSSRGGGLAERLEPLRAGSLFTLVAAAFIASYGYIPSAMVIALAGSVEACVQAVAIPAGITATAAISPPGWIGRGQGLYSAVGTAAAGTSALVAAPFYAHLGGGPVFAATGAVSALLAVSGLASGWGHRHPQARSLVVTSP
jgi:hypothetical protein